MVILLLVFLDEFIKLIIYKFLYNVEFTILNNNMLGFKVLLNSEHSSVFNSTFLNLNVSTLTLILLNIFICLFLISLFKYFKYINVKNNAVYISLILFLSGCICSTIDRIVLGGSLDYLILLGYIIDLKDVYLFLGSIIAIIVTFKSYRKSSKKGIKEDVIFIKNYCIFIKSIIKM